MSCWDCKHFVHTGGHGSSDWGYCNITNNSILSDDICEKFLKKVEEHTIMTKVNEIRGGDSKLNAYVVCDHWDGNLYEMSMGAAEQFGYGKHFKWVEVYDIRTNKDVQEEVKKIPKITNEAIHALEMANLRGVRVNVIYFDMEGSKRAEDLVEKDRALGNAITFLPSKDWEKIHKILLKHGYNLDSHRIK